MADKKISQLTPATLPLAGTEVLPIVQSGSTVKVANNDLRPKQIQSNATSGVLQVVGPAAASTRVMTTPDANFTAARTDAGQSFSGNQEILDGNLVIGTSGKGIDFSATSSGSGTMTSELFTDYEEGTWTPTISSLTGTITTVGAVAGTYTKVGRQVTVWANWTITTNGTGATAVAVSGLPFTPSTSVVTYRAAFGRNRSLGFIGAEWDSVDLKLYFYLIKDQSYPGGNGQTSYMTFTYEV